MILQKMSLLFLAALTTLFAQCSSNKVMPQSDGPISTVLQYERTPCYGSCPAYTFELMNDGTAYYNGRYHVDHIGNHTAKLSRKKYDKLLTLIDNDQFSKLKESYIEPNISDLPMTIIMHNDHRVKFHQMRAPDELNQLSKELNEAVKNIKWTKIKDTKS